jgi:hypothetical protein
VSYARLGQRADVQAILEEFTGSGRPFIPEYSMATVYTALGDHDAAFEHLERAYALRSVHLLWLKVDRRLQPLQSDARFAGLLAKIRLL